MEPASRDLECTVDDCQMALNTVRFERELQNAFGKTAQILEAEGARAKRVEQLFLQFEIDDLRLQLGHANVKLNKSLKAESDARRQLHAACDELDRLRSSVRTSSNEMEGLERKLASLSSIDADSQRIAADNIRLSKDLARVQLEVESLRCGESSSRIPLTEKHDLERQLHFLESRMANERVIHEHTLARESQQATEIATLNARLEEKSRRFTEELQARNRREHEIHQQSLEWTAQRLSLEKRLEILGRKLPSTKDNSQVASDDNTRTQGSLNDPESRNPIHRAQTNSQQSASRFNAELTIATPGAIHARERKKKASALPGDKSSFSITPFLNRTGGAPDSPISSDGTDELHASETHPGKEARFPRASAIHSSGHSQPHDKQTGASKTAPRLAQGQESEPATLSANVKSNTNQKSSSKLDIEGLTDGASALTTHMATHAQSRPKKRKLGAQRDKNLLEGEDEEDELQGLKKPGRKLIPGSTTGRNVGLDLGPLSVSSGSHLARNRGFGGFSDFSPLKRDRRR